MTVFTPSGHHILAGTNKGWLNVISTESRQILHSMRLTNNLVIFMRLTASGRDMVVNSSDRIVRTLHLPNFADESLDFENLRLEVEHKFQDVVNRLSWNHVSISSNGEYVIASTGMHHDIYIWEKGHGSLVKILEGPKEELSVVEVRVSSTREALKRVANLRACSGILTDHLSLRSASTLVESTFGPYIPHNVGPPSLLISLRWKRTSNMSSMRMNLTYSHSKNSIKDVWTARTKMLMC